VTKNKIPLYKKLNPLWWFGNEDDGWCSEKDKGMAWWRVRECPNGCTLLCKLKWFIRNPMHNFFFYVIGFADEKVITEKGYTFWNPEGGFNFAIRVPKSKPYIKLPFVSYRGTTWEWYIGWRERGNFGFTMRK